MHFHLPKPLHGWRELIGEVGIIVVGVLIALAAEQAVEWLHWRSQVGDARRALDREVAYNLGAIAKRQQEAPCIDRRLHEIAALLSESSSRLASDASRPIGQPQLWRPRTNVWQAAIGGQVAEHMPLDTRLGYAELYDGFQWYAQKAEDETDAWSVLGELDDPRGLGPEDFAALRQARSRAQVAASKMNANLPRIIAAGARLGMASATAEETPLTADAIKALCRPLH
ncbi:MAG TPA: hypothetical protein VK192_07980 [Sphingomicrobium sp.]|jgi:hypothetical protein|nr:hypothetical protein [Sphingomicrobium sp.]